MALRVLVCGDRNWAQPTPMAQRFGLFPSDTLIITGDAYGADTMAAKMGQALGFDVRIFHADWKLYGRAAGPIRNRAMLDTKPDLVIAFHPDLAQSKGTADCVREARRRGIPVEVIS
jgi:hypothetical protein